MGAFGLAYNGIKCIVGFVKDDSEMIDTALEHAHRNLYSFVYDPVGITDVTDVVEDIVDG